MEKKKGIRVGVLSLQGDLSEHVSALESGLKKLGIKGSVNLVKTRESIASVDALVIPGGESTTMCRLMDIYGLGDEVKKLASSGVQIMGTCAGLVLLSKKGCEEVEKTKQSILGLLDVEVERNAFGRQKESFEAELDIPALGKEKFHAVFIRAPAITKAGPGVRVLAEYKGKIVAAEKDNIMVLSFHPELSGDTRMHEYFLRKIK